MSDFRVEIEVPDGDGTTAEDVVAAVLGEAARIALPEIKAIWPVRTGASKGGLSAEGPAVVGSVAYTDKVRARGSDTPIVDGEAGTIGESAASRAVDDGAITQDIEQALLQALAPLET